MNNKYKTNQYSRYIYIIYEYKSKTNQDIVGRIEKKKEIFLVLCLANTRLNKKEVTIIY